MDSEDKDLDAQKIYYAVRNMSYQGLQYVAAYGLLTLAKFKSPAEICRDIEKLDKKGGTPWKSTSTESVSQNFPNCHQSKDCTTQS